MEKLNIEKKILDLVASKEKLMKKY